MFLIISEYHEKIRGEAVARPRCYLRSTQNKEVIPAGERGSASCASLGIREVGVEEAILNLSVELRGPHQQSQGCVFIESGERDPEDTSV